MKLTLFSALCMSFWLGACGAPNDGSSSLHGDYGNKGGKFPQNPETAMTPGALCQKADEIRYPEKIKYCDRDVSSELKHEIIRKYDEQFGYAIREMDRGEFKIDHFIPLCAGGSNEIENLWPQHKTVYNITDPVEPKICELMKAGRMMQSEAIEVIKKVKFNLDAADEVLQDLENR